MLLILNLPEEKKHDDISYEVEQTTKDFKKENLSYITSSIESLKTYFDIKCVLKQKYLET